MDRWATFDCYGTLIDWMGGIRATLARLFPDRDAEALLARYHRIEPAVQEGRDLPYREVLTESLVRLAAEEGLALADADASALADSLPSWPPFPEVADSLAELRDAGWRIAILSNTDPDLLDASLRAIGVPVDLRITAAEAGSYKPAHGHWERFAAETGAARERHAHVAASLFHDVAPAAELGIPCVWINRQAEVTDLPRAAELPDLHGLAAVLERIRPAARG
ncbi:MAG: HAD-IA family hydrolase [Actinomycetota bacterium]